MPNISPDKAKTIPPSIPVATAPPSVPSVCPKCGMKKKSGKRSCCFSGGAWFKKCGEAGDANFDHSWMEGIRACEGVKAEAEAMLSFQVNKTLRGDGGEYGVLDVHTHYHAHTCKHL